MDEKTRHNFDLNIWNPAVLTDNQIYETCEEVMGTENYYCTPVPSRQRNCTQSLTTASGKNCYKYCTSWKTRTITLTYLIMLILFPILLVCSIYAIAQLQGFQLQIDQLNAELNNIRQVEKDDVGNLSQGILTERTVREAELKKMEDSFAASYASISDELRLNMSQLKSNLLNQIAILRDEVRTNLSVIMTTSSNRIMEQTLSLNYTLLFLSDKFVQFQNQSQMNLLGIQETVKFHNTEFNRIDSAILELRNFTENEVHNLNVTIGGNIECLRMELWSLQKSTYNNISIVSNTSKSDIDKQYSVHIADAHRLEVQMSRNISILRTSILQSRSDSLNNITVLRDDVQAGLTNLEVVTDNSLMSLRSEVSRVELELAIATHTNITLLNSDIKDSLEELTTLVNKNLTVLEIQMQNRVFDLSKRTEQNISALQMETQSNLSVLLEATQYNISVAVNQIDSHFNQLEVNFKRNLSVLATESSQELASITGILQRDVSQLENYTQLAVHELQSVANMTALHIVRLELQFAGNLAELKTSIVEGLDNLTTEFQIITEGLHLTDSQLFSLLNYQDARTNILGEQQNKSQSYIRLEIANLTTKLLSVKVDLSLSMCRLETLETSVMELEHTNASLKSLRINLEELAKALNGNLTMVEDVTRRVEEGLNESIKNRTLELMLNSESNFMNLQSEFSSNISHIEFVLVEMVLRLNSSIYGEIQKVAIRNQEQVSTLTEQHINETNTILNYVNVSIVALNEDREILDIMVNNISMSLNSTIYDLETLLLMLEKTQENFTQLLGNNMEKVRRSLLLVNKTNAEITMSGLSELKSHIYKNLTILESEISDMILQVKNQSLTSIKSLSSDITDLSMETTQTKMELTNLVQQTENTLQNMLGNLTIDNQEGLDQLKYSSNSNFTLLSTQLDALSIITSALFNEQMNSITIQQIQTNSSLDALNSSIRDLTMQLQQLERNVSSVGAEAEQVAQSFEDFSNSPLTLYAGCLEEREECSFTPATSDFSLGCCTSGRPINITVSVINLMKLTKAVAIPT